MIWHICNVAASNGQAGEELRSCLGIEYIRESMRMDKSHCFDHAEKNGEWLSKECSEVKGRVVVSRSRKEAALESTGINRQFVHDRVVC